VYSYTRLRLHRRGRGLAAALLGPIVTPRSFAAAATTTTIATTIAAAAAATTAATTTADTIANTITNTIAAAIAAAIAAHVDELGALCNQVLRHAHARTRDEVGVRRVEADAGGRGAQAAIGLRVHRRRQRRAEGRRHALPLALAQRAEVRAEGAQRAAPRAADGGGQLRRARPQMPRLPARAAHPLSPHDERPRQAGVVPLSGGGGGGGVGRASPILRALVRVAPLSAHSYECGAGEWRQRLKALRAQPARHMHEALHHAGHGQPVEGEGGKGGGVGAGRRVCAR